MKTALTLVLLLLTLPALAQLKTHRFKPSVYYRTFAANNPPAFIIAPGDTLITETVDAGGYSKNGVSLSEGGNPQSGPFYIDGANPEDVLAVTLVKVTLNRDYATTMEQFVKRSLPLDVIKPVYGRNGKQVRWTLNRKDGYAYPQDTHENLGDFKVSLAPFLGCIGVAAPTKMGDPQTFFAGPYGGNMDFFKVRAGTTIYFPVFHKGALLYLGDGHAAQGDGEITGDALETSMDVVLVTRIIRSNDLKISFPRMEDEEHMMTLGTAETMEEALKVATSGMLAWIQKDYKLSLSEATQVLGPLIEYRIPTLAGPEVVIVAMLKKERLKGLKK